MHVVRSKKKIVGNRKKVYNRKERIKINKHSIVGRR